MVKAGFRSTTGYSGFVDAVMSVFIASADPFGAGCGGGGGGGGGDGRFGREARSWMCARALWLPAMGPSQWGSSGGLGLVEPFAQVTMARPICYSAHLTKSPAQPTLIMTWAGD